MFSKCNYPSHVKIGVLYVVTRPYYPNPMLCYGCFRYGHPRVRCPGPQRCIHCSAERHLEENDECREAAHCINCGGPHRSNNRQCPIYKREMEVVRIKIDRNLTYPEARRQAETGISSYAAAAAQPSAEQLKLEALEKELQKRDAQIVALMNQMKRRDEKIDELMTHIKSMRTPESQQQQHQVRESRSRTANMQLRTQSPVVTEPMPNSSQKTNKKRNKSKSNNNTSPGRQSPPLKKPIADQNLQDSETVSVDEESEVDENPPSQHLQRRKR